MMRDDAGYARVFLAGPALFGLVWIFGRTIGFSGEAAILAGPVILLAWLFCLAAIGLGIWGLLGKGNGRRPLFYGLGLAVNLVPLLVVAFRHV